MTREPRPWRARSIAPCRGGSLAAAAGLGLALRGSGGGPHPTGTPPPRGTRIRGRGGGNRTGKTPPGRAPPGGGVARAAPAPPDKRRGDSKGRVFDLSEGP